MPIVAYRVGSFLKSSPSCLPKGFFSFCYPMLRQLSSNILCHAFLFTSTKLPIPNSSLYLKRIRGWDMLKHTRSFSMDTAQNSSSFSCEISILQAINLEFKSPKNLFVRYYLSAGNNERIRLNTQQISKKSDFIWNQSLSLECLGTHDSIHALKQSTVVFELRQAKALPPLLGRILGSRLLGRGEIPWEEVFGSPNLEIAKWVCLVREGLGLKQPKLKVGMRVRVNKMETEMKRKRCGIWKDECGCNCKMDYCADHDVFAIAAAMEFL